MSKMTNRFAATIAAAMLAGAMAAPMAAWTAGIGVAYEMAAMGRPMFVDVSYPYFDFGSVSGGTTPVSDNGAAASKGLNFDLTGHALSIGLRIPF
ncbi:hypothetical protein [Sagittula sp. S175]|uniref:hypothetical protein n=1 Tax=Sagittula sp. S175 TaxID=3415129 RepID=UPI003C7AC0A3